MGYSDKGQVNEFLAKENQGLVLLSLDHPLTPLYIHWRLWFSYYCHLCASIIHQNAEEPYTALKLDSREWEEYNKGVEGIK